MPNRHGKPDWTRETILLFAKQCRTRRDFHDSGARRAAVKLGCYDEAMELTPRPRIRTWTPEVIKRALDGCASKTEAWLFEKSACAAARRLGIWDSYWSARANDGS